MPGWCWDMVSLWQAFRGSGMGASSSLPNDMMEQPCLMLAAFNVMSAMQASLEDAKADPLDEDGVVDLAERCRREAQRLMGHAK